MSDVIPRLRDTLSKLHSELRTDENENRCLSLMYPCTVFFEGDKYSSVGIALYASRLPRGIRNKFLFPVEETQLSSIEYLIIEGIDNVRSEWENVRTCILYELLRSKYVSNPHIRDILLSSESFSVNYREGNLLARNRRDFDTDLHRIIYVLQELLKSQLVTNGRL
jgi:hypothetical protein